MKEEKYAHGHLSTNFLVKTKMIILIHYPANLKERESTTKMYFFLYYYYYYYYYSRDPDTGCRKLALKRRQTGAEQ